MQGAVSAALNRSMTSKVPGSQWDGFHDLQQCPGSNEQDNDRGRKRLKLLEDTTNVRSEIRSMLNRKKGAKIDRNCNLFSKTFDFSRFLDSFFCTQSVKEEIK